MNWITVVSENHRRKPLVLLAGLLSLLMAFPASAKLATDFNPNFDFSKYKTFAYIGGGGISRYAAVEPRSAE